MIINNKRIWLGLFIGIVMSFSVYGQNINAEKITVPDSKLTNLYQIDSGVYRSEQPSDADFKALEKYGIREVLNLRNRHSDDDEAAGTKIKLYRLKMKAHSVSEDQLINALRIIKNRKGQSSFIVITVLIGQAQYVLCIVLYFKECQSKKLFRK